MSMHFVEANKGCSKAERIWKNPEIVKHIGEATHIYEDYGGWGEPRTRVSRDRAIELLTLGFVKRTSYNWTARHLVLTIRDDGEG